MKNPVAAMAVIVASLKDCPAEETKPTPPLHPTTAPVVALGMSNGSFRKAVLDLDLDLLTMLTVTAAKDRVDPLNRWSRHCWHFGLNCCFRGHWARVSVFPRLLLIQ